MYFVRVYSPVVFGLVRFGDATPVGFSLVYKTKNFTADRWFMERTVVIQKQSNDHLFNTNVPLGRT